MLCQFIVSMLYIYLQVVYRAYVKQENSTSNQKNLQMRGVGIETKKKKESCPTWRVKMSICQLEEIWLQSPNYCSSKMQNRHRRDINYNVVVELVNHRVGGREASMGKVVLVLEDGWFKRPIELAGFRITTNDLCCFGSLGSSPPISPSATSLPSRSVKEALVEVRPSVLCNRGRRIWYHGFFFFC